ncbi:hypothetical protein D3C86_1445960 [compost metagenome]
MDFPTARHDLVQRHLAVELVLRRVFQFYFHDEIRSLHDFGRIDGHAVQVGVFNRHFQVTANFFLFPDLRNFLRAEGYIQFLR